MNAARDKRSLMLVHDAPIPSLAANAVQVAKMAASFNAVGMRTRLLVPRWRSGRGLMRDLEEVYGITSVRAAAWPKPRFPGCDILFGLAASAYARMISADVFYTRSVPFAGVASSLGLRTVLELHLSPRQRRGAHARRIAQCARRRSFLGIVVISEPLAEEVRETFPDLAHRVLVAHDGADPVSHDQERDRDCGAVGYVGSLYPGRLSILAGVTPHLPDTNFEIFGGSADEIAYWKEQFPDQDHVRFHGFLKSVDLHDAYRRFSIAVAPYGHSVQTVGGSRLNTSSYMSPLKVFEYMANGMAIVASDLPVLREVLRHDHNALLCDPERPDDWTRAIARLVGDPDLRQRLGDQARRDFLASYTWHRRAERIMEFIEERIAATGRDGR